MSHAGYNNRVILLPFPELAEGCSVLIRNPRLMAPQELEAAYAAVDGDSTDTAAARDGMHTSIAKMIIAWRNVYPADLDLSGVDLSGETDLEALMATLNDGEQQPLGAPSKETVAQVPLAIINKIAEQITEISDPQ